MAKRKRESHLYNIYIYFSVLVTKLYILKEIHMEHFPKKRNKNGSKQILVQ